MTQSTILASGNTDATSTDVVLAAGESCTLGLFSATPGAQVTQLVKVVMATPGADNFVARLSSENMQVQVSGPGTFRVVRKAQAGATSFGVFKEV